MKYTIPRGNGSVQLGEKAAEYFQGNHQCTSSRDNYKVSVWLITGIRNYLDTASYDTIPRGIVSMVIFTLHLSHKNFILLDTI